jgi:hypothetical protein
MWSKNGEGVEASAAGIACGETFVRPFDLNLPAGSSATDVMD